MSDETELLIVGAGPAGMSAAVAARRMGLRVIVLDENSEPGGQIYRRILGNEERDARRRLLGTDYARGLPLARAFVASGADIRAGSTVVEISDDGSASIASPGRGAYVVKPRATLIATGANERAFAVPGWTLPGVMTAGAAQTLLKTSGQIPAGRVVLAGGGPLLWLVASQLGAAGAELGAVLSYTRPLEYLHGAGDAVAAWRSFAALAKGARWIASLRSRGVKLVHGAQVLRIEEREGKRVVHYQAGDRTATEPADIVLLHAGVVPNIQASQSLRLEHVWSDTQFCWRPATDLWATSSNPNILVAGDGAGISGAEDAARGGELAALGLAAKLGRITTGERDRLASPIFAQRRTQEGLRVFLDTLYAPPHWLRVPSDDATIVCRCEQVSAGAIREAVRLGADGPNQVKAFVRAGMGPCQGRMCAQTVAAVIARERGLPCSQVPTQRVRPPLKPLHLADLADMPPGPGEEIEAVPALTVSSLKSLDDSTAAGPQSH
ncbi:MAG: FAD-dependent oxidoreductase [Burkholderiaceae bacterium]|nr:FAD-dependent oxidoreductase [Burkholderiaceae bacterium]